MRRLLCLAMFVMPLLLHAQECVLEVSDVTCDGTSVSFNLTLTSNGTPHSINDSGSIAFGTVDGGGENSVDEVLRGFSLVGSSTPIDNLPVTLELKNGFSCDDVLGKELELYSAPRGGSGSSTISCESNGTIATFGEASPKEVPTFGQWSILLFGLGILSLGILLMVRNGKLEEVA